MKWQFKARKINYWIKKLYKIPCILIIFKAQILTLISRFSVLKLRTTLSLTDTEFSLPFEDLYMIIYKSATIFNYYRNIVRATNQMDDI